MFLRLHEQNLVRAMLLRPLVQSRKMNQITSQRSDQRKYVEIRDIKKYSGALALGAGSVETVPGSMYLLFYPQG